MTSPLWLKLWIDLLDDPKIADMPDWLFRRFIYLLLAAKEYDKDGLLQPVSKLAWRLRLGEDQVEEALRALSEVGVVCEDAMGWTIINFKKRQMVSDSADRMRRMRERRKTEALRGDVSQSYSSSDIKQKGIFVLYEQEIGLITKTISDALAAAEEEYPGEWFLPAFKLAAEHNARNWAYVEAVLKRWKVDGFQSQRKANNYLRKETAGERFRREHGLPPDENPIF